MYHQMKKQTILEAVQLIAELGEKFPMLPINQINFYELAKFYQKNPKDLISMVVFLDCMKHMNGQSEEQIRYFVNLEEVSKIKVKKNEHQWVFDVYKNAQEKIKLNHVYSHQF